MGEEEGEGLTEYADRDEYVEEPATDGGEEGMFWCICVGGHLVEGEVEEESARGACKVE